MPVDTIAASLLRVELFRHLKPLQITEIARHSERIVFRRGEVITEAGASADAAYLIVGGPALLVGGGDLPGETSTVEPSSIVGEMAMFIEHDYASTVVADGPVRALKITRDGMRTQLLDDPGLATELMNRIAARLSDVAMELRRIDAALHADTTATAATTA